MAHRPHCLQVLRLFGRVEGGRSSLGPNGTNHPLAGYLEYLFYVSHGMSSNLSRREGLKSRTAVIVERN
jgi:hypothetical protein